MPFHVVGYDYELDNANLVSDIPETLDINEHWNIHIISLLFAYQKFKE
jgi:hypothetical protein